MTGRLAVVVAHPDDDTFACAASVARHADAPGFRFVLLHATSGEAGRIADPSLATPATLGAVREEEDRRAWVALGREPDRHEWFRYPDGGVVGVPFEALVERIAAVLDEERPDVVLTFGPDGITGHPDHVVTGVATTVAFHRVRARGGAGLRRLVWAALPASSIDAWNAWRADADMPPFDPLRIYDPHGVDDATIGYAARFPDDVAHRVIRSLAEHRTQADDVEAIPEERRMEAFGAEHGVVAWPARRPGDPVLGDLFEGL